MAIGITSKIINVLSVFFKYRYFWIGLYIRIYVLLIFFVYILAEFVFRMDGMYKISVVLRIRTNSEQK